MTAENLHRVADLNDLRDRGRMLVRPGGRQIALFAQDDTVLACNNRCPHEGYPLIEGSLADSAPDGRPACVLTCNWHNWKFDLDGGANLTGGDRLRTYPVHLKDGEVWLDLTDPPAEARIADAMAALRDSFPRHEYDRIARELRRLQQAGGDPLEAVRAAIEWTHDRFEFGATHAQATAADWLMLHDEVAESDVERLAVVSECMGHFAWDSRREPVYAFPTGRAPFDPAALTAAIGAEDEEAAVAQVRGAYADGLTYADLRPALARAALAHYQDFGHAAIYVVKTGDLIDRLGPAVALPATLSLVRQLVNAFREDLIPEFRHYAAALEAWDGAGRETPEIADFTGASINKALDLAVARSADIDGLYRALLGAAAWNMLHFDMTVMQATAGPVSRNVGWLDLTHAITFANAVRRLCTADPALWPQGLLQMACFVGRNAGYTDTQLDIAAWQVAAPEAFATEMRRRVLDHGLFEYIVACHWVKTTCAVHEEIARDPQMSAAPLLAAALNRFVNSPFKRKHTLRTASQAIAFVDAGG